MSSARYNAMSNLQEQIDLANLMKAQAASTKPGTPTVGYSPADIAAQQQNVQAAQSQLRFVQIADQQRKELLTRLRILNARLGGSRAGRAVASLPTPGGITIPLIILLFLFLALIPVNGHTRLRWLFLTITGNAKLNPASLITVSAVGAPPGFDLLKIYQPFSQTGPTSPFPGPPPEKPGRTVASSGGMVDSMNSFGGDNRWNRFGKVVTQSQGKGTDYIDAEKLRHDKGTGVSDNYGSVLDYVTILRQNDG